MEDLALKPCTQWPEASALPPRRAGYDNGDKRKISDKPRGLIKLDPKVSIEEQRILQNTYPELNLEFTGKEVRPHAFAAISRKLETEMCFKKIKRPYNHVMYDQNGDVATQYAWDDREKKEVIIPKATIKDIGGNWFNHAALNRSAVHCCTPLLTAEDVVRYQRRENDIYEYRDRARGDKRAYLNEVITNYGERFFCLRKGQECTHKAPFGMMVHVYDIPIAEIVDIMVDSSMSRLVGCMIFTPEILFRTDGEIFTVVNSEDIDVGGVNRKDEKRSGIRTRFKVFDHVHGNQTIKMIRFDFVGDYNHGYVHEYSTYSQFFTTPYPSGKKYPGEMASVELQENRNGVQFYEITLLTKPMKIKTLSYTSLHVPSLRNHIVIYGWTLSHENASYVMRRIMRVVPLELYDKLLAFALRYEKDTFNILQIYHYACSINSRFIVNGVNVRSPESIETKVLYELAGMVYILAYIMRYTSGLTIKRIVEDIKNARAAAAMPAFYGFFHSLFSKMFSKKETKMVPGSFNLLREANTEEGKPSSWLSGWTDIAYKFPVSFQLVGTIDLVTYLDYQSKGTLQEHYTFRENGEEIPQTVPTEKPETTSNELCDQQSEAVLEAELAGFIRHNVASQGWCFYQSIASAYNLLNPKGEVKTQEQVREMLAAASAVYGVPQDLKDKLAQPAYGQNLPLSLWGGSDDAHLFATVEQIKVVLYHHGNDLLYRTTYNLSAVDVIYLYLKDNHCIYLTKVTGGAAKEPLLVLPDYVTENFDRRTRTNKIATDFQFGNVKGRYYRKNVRELGDQKRVSNSTPEKDVDLSTLNPPNYSSTSVIRLYRGDITKVKTAAVVVVNSNAGKIIEAAGPELEQEIRLTYPDGMPNRTVVTSGYNLPATFVIHTVSPEVDPKVVKKYYHDILMLCVQSGIKSVCFSPLEVDVKDPKIKEVIIYSILSMLKKILNRNKAFEEIVLCMDTVEDRKMYVDCVKRVDITINTKSTPVCAPPIVIGELADVNTEFLICVTEDGTESKVLEGAGTTVQKLYEIRRSQDRYPIITPGGAINAVAIAHTVRPADSKVALASYYIHSLTEALRRNARQVSIVYWPEMGEREFKIILDAIAEFEVSQSAVIPAINICFLDGSDEVAMLLIKKHDIPWSKPKATIDTTPKCFYGQKTQLGKVILRVSTHGGERDRLYAIEPYVLIQASKGQQEVTTAEVCLSSQVYELMFKSSEHRSRLFTTICEEFNSRFNVKYSCNWNRLVNLKRELGPPTTLTEDTPFTKIASRWFKQTPVARKGTLKSCIKKPGVSKNETLKIADGAVQPAKARTRREHLTEEALGKMKWVSQKDTEGVLIAREGQGTRFNLVCESASYRLPTLPQNAISVFSGETFGLWRSEIESEFYISINPKVFSKMLKHSEGRNDLSGAEGTDFAMVLIRFLKYINPHNYRIALRGLDNLFLTQQNNVCGWTMAPETYGSCLITFCTEAVDLPITVLSIFDYEYHLSVLESTTRTCISRNDYDMLYFLVEVTPVSNEDFKTRADAFLQLPIDDCASCFNLTVREMTTTVLSSPPASPSVIIIGPTQRPEVAQYLSGLVAGGRSLRWPPPFQVRKRTAIEVNSGALDDATPTEVVKRFDVYYTDDNDCPFLWEEEVGYELHRGKWDHQIDYKQCRNHNAISPKPQGSIICHISASTREDTMRSIASLGQFWQRSTPLHFAGFDSFFNLEELTAELDAFAPTFGLPSIIHTVLPDSDSPSDVKVAVPGAALDEPDQILKERVPCEEGNDEISTTSAATTNGQVPTVVGQDTSQGTPVDAYTAAIDDGDENGATVVTSLNLPTEITAAHTESDQGVTVNRSQDNEDLTLEELLFDACLDIDDNASDNIEDMEDDIYLATTLSPSAADQNLPSDQQGKGLQTVESKVSKKPTSQIGCAQWGAEMGQQVLLDLLGELRSEVADSLDEVERDLEGDDRGDRLEVVNSPDEMERDLEGDDQGDSPVSTPAAEQRGGDRSSERLRDAVRLASREQSAETGGLLTGKSLLNTYAKSFRVMETIFADLDDSDTDKHEISEDEGVDGTNSARGEEVDRVQRVEAPTLEQAGADLIAEGEINRTNPTSNSDPQEIEVRGTDLVEVDDGVKVNIDLGTSKKLDNLETVINRLARDADAFTGRAEDQEYLRLDDALTVCALRLDSISEQGARTRRRALINHINNIAANLESKCNSNAPIGTNVGPDEVGEENLTFSDSDSDVEDDEEDYVNTADSLAKCDREESSALEQDDEEDYVDVVSTAMRESENTESGVESDEDDVALVQPLGASAAVLCDQTSTPPVTSSTKTAEQDVSDAAQYETIKLDRTEVNVSWLLEGPAIPHFHDEWKRMEIDITERHREIRCNLEFCDEELIAQILSEKDRLEGFNKDQIALARKRADPYETINRLGFVNRASLKLAELDALTGFVLTAFKISNTMSDIPAYFMDLCAAPGGFTQYVLRRALAQNVNGIGFSLVNGLKYDPVITSGVLADRYQLYHGVTGTGDITDDLNHESIEDYVTNQTSGNLQLVLADGGFDFGGAESMQENSVRNLLISECIVAVTNLQDGGNFVCKLFDTYTSFTIGLIYVMWSSFDKISIIKPHTSRPANSERYLVCLGLRTRPIDYLHSIHRVMNQLKDTDRDINQVVPVKAMLAQTEFCDYIRKVNQHLGEKQLAALKLLNTCLQDRTAVVECDDAVQELFKNLKLDERIHKTVYTPPPPSNIVGPLFDYAVNAAEEIIKSWVRDSDRVLANLKTYAQSFNKNMSKSYYIKDDDVQLRVYDTVKRKGITDDQKFKLNLANYSHCFWLETDGELKIVKVPKTADLKSVNHLKLPRSVLYLMVCKKTEIFNEYEYAQKYRGYSREFIKYRLQHCGTTLSLTEGTPGCGKTTYIINQHDYKRDRICTATRDGIKDIRSRLKTALASKIEIREEGDKRVECVNVSRTDEPKYMQMTHLLDSYRTLDSLLLNTNGDTRAYFVDEALMQHPGKIVLLICTTSPERVELLGDRGQIGFINRSDTPMSYTSFDFIPTKKLLNTSYRCPADVAALFTKSYAHNSSLLKKNDLPFMVTKTETNTLHLRRIRNVSDVPNQPGDVKYLTFTQPEKKVLEDHLRSKYPEYKRGVSTVHEWQGSQCDHVVLVRLNTKQATQVFTYKEHILVAMTRHRLSFQYCVLNTIDDGIVQKLAEARKLKHEDKLKHIKKQSAGYSPEMKDLAGDVYVQASYLVEERPTVPETDPYIDPIRLDIKSNIFQPMVYNKEVARDVNLISIAARRNYTRPEVEFNHVVLQEFVNQVLPGHSTLDTTYDAHMVHFNDLEVNVENISIIADRIVPVGRYVPRSILTDVDRFIDPNEGLVPLIRTAVPVNREQTHVETLLGMIKRNMNVPELGIETDEEALAQRMFKRAIVSFYNQDSWKALPVYKNRKIYGNAEALRNWAVKNKISPKTLHMNDPDHLYNSAYDKPLNNYTYMIKTQVKPKLDETALHEYSAVQTIAYHDKDVTALFSPIFRDMNFRKQNSLRENCIVFTDMSNADFEDKLNALFPNPGVLENRTALQCDISKYDKSQGLVVLYYNKYNYECFGMDPEMAELWFRIHVDTILRSKEAGIQANIKYQRKSGDSDTFRGNTETTMGILAALYDLYDVYGDRAGFEALLAHDPSPNWMDKFIAGLIAWSEVPGNLIVAKYDVAAFAGDDSWIVGGEMLKEDKSTTAELLFNLETKFFVHKCHYFCSRIIVPTYERWVVVPDPVKLVTKLGRSDIRSYAHLEEYRVSLLDLTSGYNDPAVDIFVSDYIAEIYKTDCNVGPVLDHLISAIRNPLYFRKLFSPRSRPTSELVSTDKSLVITDSPKIIKELAHHTKFSNFDLYEPLTVPDGSVVVVPDMMSDTVLDVRFVREDAAMSNVEMHTILRSGKTILTTSESRALQLRTQNRYVFTLDNGIEHSAFKVRKFKSMRAIRNVFKADTADTYARYITCQDLARLIAKKKYIPYDNFEKVYYLTDNGNEEFYSKYLLSNPNILYVNAPLCDLEFKSGVSLYKNVAIKN